MLALASGTVDRSSSKHVAQLSISFQAKRRKGLKGLIVTGPHGMFTEPQIQRGALCHSHHYDGKSSKFALL